MRRADQPNVAGIVGSSPVVRQLLSVVRKVAATDAVVLLRGESGTGKELLARAVHETSPRTGKPYVKVHCAALSANLLESELFGHVKGAFTGAHRDKIGRFELANGGTLFLDEIGDISLEVQTKLLRVLQEKTLERVGSSEPLKVDVRIITATHQNLEELIRQGRFREDLFYRLNVFPIQVARRCANAARTLPSWRCYFIQQSAQRCKKNVLHIDDDAAGAAQGARLAGQHPPTGKRHRTGGGDCGDGDVDACKTCRAELFQVRDARARRLSRRKMRRARVELSQRA